MKMNRKILREALKEIHRITWADLLDDENLNEMVRLNLSISDIFSVYKVPPRKRTNLTYDEKGSIECDKIKITKDMLKGKGTKLLSTGLTTDKKINYYGFSNVNHLLKFVVCKGHFDTWYIYLENMEEIQSFKEVRKFGNKIHPKTAKLLVDCDDEVLKMYEY